MTQASTLVSTDQIVLVPISLIRPNPDNPRGPVFPAEAQVMAESMKEKGQKAAIIIRPMTDEEKSQYPPYEYLLLGGHVRLEGAKLAGLETLKAIIVEPSNVVDEMMDAALDNRFSDMGWWRWDLLIEWFLKTPNPPSQRKLADQLGMSVAKINNAVKVTEALNQSSRSLVEANLQKTLISDVQPLNTQNKGFLITESHLLALAGLEDPTLVEKGLREVLDNYLTEGQTRKLVAQLKSPKITAGPTAKTPVEEEAFHKSPLSLPLTKGGGGDLSGTEVAASSTPAYSAGTPRNDGQKSTANSPAPTQETGSFSSLVLGWMAGITLFSRIRAKLKKGEKITLSEFLILAIDDMAEAALWAWKKVLHPVLKMLWGIAKKAFHGVWWMVKKTGKVLRKPFGMVGEKLAEYAVWGLVLFLAGWVLWNLVIHHVSPGQSLKKIVMWPVHKVESWFEPQRHEGTKGNEAVGLSTGETKPAPFTPSTFKPETVSAQASTFKPVTQTAHAVKTSQKIQADLPASRSFSAGMSPVALAQGDEIRATWEAEASALPPTVRVKGFPVQVDKAMGGTMAESRLTDLGYSETTFLMQGHDRHKILSAHPDSVNFTLASDAGLGSLLGEKPKLAFYWEDLKAIHCNEVDVEPGTAKARVFYQCGLVLSSLPKPIVFQCATAGDMEHLVSALEFYVHASGHPQVPLSGLPYVDQGLLSGNKDQVTALWAQSPADEALVNLGDYVWSVGYSDSRQGRSDLEEKLQGLTPGTHALYVVTPAEWRKAQEDKGSDSFNPQRRKVVLTVP